jgi:hypothetical protein
MRLSSLLATIVLGLSAGFCAADTVFLNDGTEVEGTIVESNDHTVVIRQSNGAVRSIRKSDVDTVVSSKSKDTSSTADATPSAGDSKKKSQDGDSGANTTASDAPKENASIKTNDAKAAHSDAAGNNAEKKKADGKDGDSKGKEKDKESPPSDKGSADGGDSAGSGDGKPAGDKPATAHGHHGGQGKH